jgi:hypothetical protein
MMYSLVSCGFLVKLLIAPYQFHGVAKGSFFAREAPVFFFAEARGLAWF